MKHLTEELKRQPAEAKLGSEGLGTRQEQRWVLLKKMPQCYNSSCMIRTTGELDCSKAHIRLMELGKSEDKAKSTDLKERNADSRRRIVGPWAWQRHGTAEARLP
ncbi:hypothetical protein BHE74_00049998 [Ensete ventricosum]|nr:hypothetical protein BHE74_00049998 [Ensete ventricosum]